MKYQTIKSDTELGNLPVSITRQNDAIVEVVVYFQPFEEGARPPSSIRITEKYGNLAIDIPAPPKKVKKFKLHGKFAGLADVEELFEEEYEAKARLREYEKKYRGDDAEIGLAIDEVEVEEE